MEQQAAVLGDESRKAAERLLARRFGGKARIEGYDTLRGEDSRSLVLRLRLESGGGPSTAILKEGHQPDGSRFKPEETAFGTPAARFHNDWSGLMLLNDVQRKGAPIVPSVYGADRKLGVLLIEDLGDGPNLADALLGADADLATKAVIDFASSLGQIGARTRDRFDDYQRLRKAANAPKQGVEELRANVRATVAQLDHTFEEVGFEWTPELVDDIEQVSAAMQDPGPFYTYSHGDACTDNVVLTDGGVLFFDFEYGGFRHALLDGAYFRFPFPTCAYVNRLPRRVVERAESAYRYELAKGLPEAEDDDAFYRGITEACAYWFLVTCNWHLREALRFDRKWGSSTLRQRFVHRSGQLAETTRELGYLRALGAFAARLHDRLRGEWPTLPEMPLFPAFR